LWDEGDVVNLGYMCDLAHQHDSLAGVQLWYSGIHAINMESREVPRGATQLASNVWASRTVYGYEMDEDDIKAVINMYVEAAKRAEVQGYSSDSGWTEQYSVHTVPQPPSAFMARKCACVPGRSEPAPMQWVVCQKRLRIRFGPIVIGSNRMS
ncbi:MAG: hypothetical protein HOA58_02500, partial [Rhodospirillaceae bacterium]|nr:hypothetical protein [Rhodospirillaceae bacterium]